jgi:TonB-dependent SusC/RagA subfamily outer membrane receptor
MLAVGIVFYVYTTAQERVVTGIITTFDSIAVNGASINVRSTKQTVLSDSMGNFAVSCDKNDKLKISAAGFFNETVKIDENTKYVAVNLKLKAGDKNLELASAFTSVEDRDKLNALASRSSNELDLSMYSNFFDAIQGKFPGLQVQGTDIIVRGAGSISGPTPALIVLDGVVVSGATLNAINPETVKRVNVIKDGSSAIYGSRAAFGVVEITTKSGGEMN